MSADCVSGITRTGETVMKLSEMEGPLEQDELWSSRDYREYLRGWLERTRAKRPTFSIRSLARRLAIDASLLGRIFQGERHLAASRIQPVCDVVGLTGERAEYFRHMVLFAKSKTAREAQALFSRMQELRRVAPVPLADTQESYWDSWVHVALRSLLTCGDFGDDWEELGRLLHPPQAPRTVKTAMSRLSRMGMVVKDDRGFWRPSTQFVKDRTGAHTRALRNFHRQSLLLATDAIEGVDPSRRNLSSATVAIDEAKYEELVRLVDELRLKALTLAEATPAPNQVVQIAIQIVPQAGRGIRGNRALDSI